MEHNGNKIREVVRDETALRPVRPEAATRFRAANIVRKTSISVPNNLDEMEDLRIDRQKVSLISILRVPFFSKE